MTRVRIPEEVLAAAHDRAAARAAQGLAGGGPDPGRDRGGGLEGRRRAGRTSRSSRPHAPTVEDGGAVRYGSSAAVPSRLRRRRRRRRDRGRRRDRLAGRRRRARWRASGRTRPPARRSWWSRMDRRPSRSAGADRRTTADGSRSSARARGSGTRRRAGTSGSGERPAPIVVVLDGSARADRRRRDAAGRGARRSDGRRRRRLRDRRATTSAGSSDARPGDVTAIEGYAIAFRRERCRGARPARRALPLLPQPRHLVEPRPPRRGGGDRAAASRRRPDPGDPPRAPRLDDRSRTAERDRLSKRNFYRIIDRFGSRRDLAT